MKDPRDDRSAASAAPPAGSSGWSAWQPLHPSLCLQPAVLAELLDGGQAFRWWRGDDGSWVGQWADRIAAVRHAPDDTLEWRAPRPIAPDVAEALPRYLGLDAAHAAALDALPWRSDAHLEQALAACHGLRLLRQPFGETLLAFLCSATKQIVQIKQMVALLACRLGQPIVFPQAVARAGAPAGAATAAGPLALGLPGELGWRLPTWPELAHVPEAELRACLLGFRARYIRATAEFLAGSPDWLEQTASLPYAEAKERLCQLPGVGEKVADCVLLFGAGRGEAFPVDVWILKAMARRYGLTGWTPAQVAHFGRVHFGAYAGLAQQYLFAFERAAARTR